MPLQKSGETLRRLLGGFFSAWVEGFMIDLKQPEGERVTRQVLRLDLNLGELRETFQKGLTLPIQ